ncbi:phenylalanine--tRNA ligase subunit beta [Limosilactobacillus secaliphilus]|uniref:Phenylalanine--tRNA ligase beta subunit n=1 Tax=Limosilactobacillus secaliphilus TaxID=396268 RepID=A0A0R2I940_9LACO|nr:phenylalanine--tRNA ligase subunit beta [Limosilactobacillus secaliphilus]KRN59141.1 phenylalanyl-tRNA synthetase, beta subunit [Limosilactobacillus secaliphilus]
MKVSYQWLNEYLPLAKNGIKPAALAEKLARTSVDINEVSSPKDGLKKVVVGLVKECVPHPNSDHLHVCQVQVSDDETVQIVCGAPNVAAGEKVIVALHGARIGNNVKIKRSKMRGEESNGMLCALQELGVSTSVTPKSDDEGIWILPDDAKVGEPVWPYVGMDDTIIDTDVTPNRGDMLSIYGNVNDLSAIYDLKKNFRQHALASEDGGPASDKVKISVADDKIAPVYKMRVIENVKVADSPLWLKVKLMNSGVRPINNVVDITNYILLKYGQPLHSFDYDKLPSHDINVRHAHEGEKLTTLDDEERVLKANDIVIAAGDTAVALAGTMGGKSTMVDNNTKTVALEAAIFDPVMVRKQARRLDLHSESSMRFERGINPETVETALNEAAYWLTQLANGTVDQGIVVGNQSDYPAKTIQMSTAKVNDTLGTDLSLADLLDIFRRLDFATEKIDDDQFKVVVPARRWDISIPADLNEEIARLYGYDKIPSTLPVMTRTLGGLTDRQRRLRASRHVLEGLGLDQAISYSLTTVAKAKQFMVEPQDVEPMVLSYPMSSDHVATRMNIVSGLLNDIAYNHARNVDNVALYEQGRVFIPAGGERPREEEHVAGAVTGSLYADNWHMKGDQIDFFQLKGIVEQYLKNFAVNGKVEFVADSSRPEMHPGRTANILLDNQQVGFIGEVHPQTAKEYKIPETYVFELNLEALLKADRRDKHYEAISKYPSITRDIALLVDSSVTNADVVNAINEKGGAFLTDVHLFDVYEGSHLPKGKKSLAYTLTYRDQNDTLKEETVNKAFAKVEAHLTDALGAEIR